MCACSKEDRRMRASSKEDRRIRVRTKEDRHIRMRSKGPSTALTCLALPTCAPCLCWPNAAPWPPGSALPVAQHAAHDAVVERWEGKEGRGAALERCGASCLVRA